MSKRYFVMKHLHFSKENIWFCVWFPKTKSDIRADSVGNLISVHQDIKAYLPFLTSNLSFNLNKTGIFTNVTAKWRVLLCSFMPNQIDKGRYMYLWVNELQYETVEKFSSNYVFIACFITLMPKLLMLPHESLLWCWCSFKAILNWCMLGILTPQPLINVLVCDLWLSPFHNFRKKFIVWNWNEE